MKTKARPSGRAFFNKAQSIAAHRAAGPRESLRSKVSWGSEERRRDEKSPGLLTGAFARTGVRDELGSVDKIDTR